MAARAAIGLGLRLGSGEPDADGEALSSTDAAGLAVLIVVVGQQHHGADHHREQHQDAHHRGDQVHLAAAQFPLLPADQLALQMAAGLLAALLAVGH